MPADEKLRLAIIPSMSVFSPEYAIDYLKSILTHTGLIPAFIRDI